MKKLLKLERDSAYYWGLVLMMTLPFALIVEFWIFSFSVPAHFLIYLIIYGWGYLLLTKSDFTRRLTSFEEEIKKISAQLPVSNSILPEPEQSTDTLSPMGV